VAETVMTGLLGGGHALYFDASSGRARNLDCFVAVPGLGREPPRDAELVELQVPFGAELVHYAVGPASCGVPGLPAGLGLLHREHGRLPWARLVEPALRLARDGVEFPPAHAACLAMLAPVMTMDTGARIYSPGGRLLQAGERLLQPGLGPALEALAEEGPRSAYDGTLADALLALMEDRGGLVTRDDLRAYEAQWREPVEYAFAGTHVLTRAGLAPVGDTLVRLPTLRGLSPARRAVMLTRTLVSPEREGDTTNLAIVDAEGNACVVTSSLGLGSGDFVPGLDLQLNSMLGESDLIRGPLEPGERMASMMSPLVALDGNGPALAAGAAGGTRLRGALVQVVAGILDEGARSRRSGLAAAASPGRRSGQPRAGARRRGRAGAGATRGRGPRVAGATPLLRRRQRRYAKRRGRGSTPKWFCVDPSLALNGDQPRYPHSGQPGFAAAVPRLIGLVYGLPQSRQRTRANAFTSRFSYPS
jgi:gamma-glutamyltranspeptidase/glutathione hydrolase